MTWFKVDDALHAHPKVMALSFGARGLWVTAGSWCAQFTDGAVPKHVLAAWGAPLELAAELVESGLWDVTPAGWQFHDWLLYQPSKASVVSKRKEASERMTRLRSGKTVRANTPTVRETFATPGPVPSRSSLSSSEKSSNLSTTTTSPSFAPENDQSGGGSISLTPPGAEHAGYRWLSDVLGTFPADLGSWRREYAAIGSKPAEELQRVAKHVQNTAWCMANRSRCTPRHLLKHWQEFVEGPRNFELKPPVVAMDFKSQREAAQKAYTNQRLSKFDAEMSAYIALAKTDDERKRRTTEWQTDRVRLDRSLP
jgi:hypothetical protein